MKKSNLLKRKMTFLFFVALAVMVAILVWLTRPAEDASGPEDYYVFWVDPERHKVQFYLNDDLGERLANFGNLQKHVEIQKEKLIFAMNGGIFDPGGKPKGLLIQGGQTIQGVDLNGGEGNFYWRPNGLLLISPEGPRIVESSRYSGNEAMYALQSGPLLIENGVIHPEFDPKSKSIFIRNGVGMNGKGELVFVLSKKEITLYEFARFFKDELRVEDALYLDGFVSKIYWPEAGLNDGGGDFGVMIGVLDGGD